MGITAWDEKSWMGALGWLNQVEAETAPKRYFTSTALFNAEATSLV